jgi:uncharacterized protein (DUF1697 family)
MPALKTSFEDAGFGNVTTYIQSGNVIFDAPSSSQSELTHRIEGIVRTAFAHYDASVVLRSKSQMRSIIDRAPKGFGTEPTKYRYDVVFLKPPLTAKTAIKDIATKEGVDRIWAGTGVLYMSRLDSRATQSRLNRVASLPIYKDMTIRNWNTTTKLVALLDAEPWVAGREGSFCHLVVIHSARRAGFEPRLAHITNDFSVAYALVAARAGVALVPELAGPPPPGVVVKPLAGAPPSRRIYAAIRAGSADRPAVAALLAALKGSDPFRYDARAPAGVETRT